VIALSSELERASWGGSGFTALFGSMTRLRDSDMRRNGPILIGDDVWVAQGAFIEPGVSVGAGSIVSVGSIVTTDVPPNAIAVGNSAQSPLGGDVKNLRPAARAEE
jgi:acetyltransferase-like isoleucine patch superfamily enzyme